MTETNNPERYPCAHCGRVLLPAYDAKLIPPHTRPAYVHHVRDAKVVTAFCLLCMVWALHRWRSPTWSLKGEALWLIQSEGSETYARRLGKW